MNHQKLFLEANYYWNTNQLHQVITLHRYKTTSIRKKLTDLEATILRGLLCDLTLPEIACHFPKEFYSTIANVTKNLFQDLQKITGQQDNKFGNHIQWLTAAGYQKSIFDKAVIVSPISKSISQNIAINPINQFAEKSSATQIQIVTRIN